MSVSPLQFQIFAHVPARVRWVVRFSGVLLGASVGLTALTSVALASSSTIALSSVGSASAAAMTEGAVTAAQGAGEARKFVQDKHAALNRAVKAAKDPKTDATVAAVFDAMLNYEALTRDSLGSQWQVLNPDQQKQFGELLKQLVQKSYRKNLRDPEDYSVEYTGEVDAAQGTLVKTLAQKKGNKRDKPLSIDYVVGSVGEALKVRDVVTDGVSLVGNYRSQFKRIIKKKGVDGLLEQMRKQLDN